MGRPRAGATFVGAALTTNVIPGTTGPLVQGYSFDLTLNAGEAFTGAFANIGVTLFESGGIPHQSDQFFAIPANTTGTFHVVLTGLTDANNGHVPLIPEFAPGETAVQSGFQLWLNKTADPITLYVDNIRTAVPEPASLLAARRDRHAAALAAAADGLIENIAPRAREGAPSRARAIANSHGRRSGTRGRWTARLTSPSVLLFGRLSLPGDLAHADDVGAVRYSNRLDRSGAGLRAANAPRPGQRRVVAYFAGWSTLRVADIPADSLTHIIYAFAQIIDGRRAATPRWHREPYPDDPPDVTWSGHFRQLQILKRKHPHLKTLISVGGWNDSPPFSDAAHTDASRQKFARSCADFVSRYGFDGIDIDWEYPGGGGKDPDKSRPEDTRNFTLLLRELRRQLDEQGKTDQKKYLLTIATPAGPGQYRLLELDQVHAYVDWINLMTYDLAGSWSRKTTFHAPLYVPTDDNIKTTQPANRLSVDDAVRGVPGRGGPTGEARRGCPVLRLRVRRRAGRQPRPFPAARPQAAAPARTTRTAGATALGREIHRQIRPARLGTSAEGSLAVRRRRRHHDHLRRPRIAAVQGRVRSAQVWVA